MKARQKKCAHCHDYFIPMNSLQKCCSVPCAIAHVKAEKDKEERKELKVRKLNLKTRGQWLKEAQQAFNAYIRERDYTDPCISCGRHHNGQYHAGHYMTVGAHPELRFHEDNVHKQCSACNEHLSGNLVNYRIRLIEKIGSERVEALESKHDPIKLTIEQIKNIKTNYQTKLKALKRQHEEAA